MTLEQIIAAELKIKPQQVHAALELLDSGNTIPFIARYRKEATGTLDEEALRSIEERAKYLRQLEERRAEILAAIEAQEKLTPELKTQIEAAVKMQELEDLYPDKTPSEREQIVTREYRTVCIMQIGGKLKSGVKHDGRAPDYDDWSLNGDIFFWLDSIDSAIEISSMGIRVTPEVMKKQLEEDGSTDRLELPFHKALMNNELPLTIGGGIGQSRLCMLLLGKRHIGEVQASVWPDDMIEDCAKQGIYLL